MQGIATFDARKATYLALVAGLMGAVTWAFWTTLMEASEKWSHDPQYSHGYLVPLFALALLWLRRSSFPAEKLRPSWWGAPLLLAGVALRLVGTYYYFAWFDAIALLPCIAGAIWMLGSWPLCRWALPAVAFLAFMIPLPYKLEVMMAEPLQRLATIVSTFALQTLGLPALAEGNVILLNDVRMGIVEACSGLRMMVIFFALSTAVAMVVRRPMWERLLIAASAVPIALIANLTRITVTGVLHDTVGSEIANAVFHDLAGWLMMPFALLILGLELSILNRLWIEPAVAPSAVTMKVAGVRGGVAPTRTPWRKPSPVSSHETGA
jgi:exosortase